MDILACVATRCARTLRTSICILPHLPRPRLLPPECPQSGCMQSGCITQSGHAVWVHGTWNPSWHLEPFMALGTLHGTWNPSWHLEPLEPAVAWHLEPAVWVHGTWNPHGTWNRLEPLVTTKTTLLPEISAGFIPAGSQLRCYYHRRHADAIYFGLVPMGSQLAG